jgi:hypothetical protein
MRSLLFLTGAAAVAVTPVEKVMNLLAKLQTKMEEDGKAEAAAYDKFACFCKEQADNKQYAIEQSTDKIAKLSARIEKLAADITVHNENAAAAKKTVEDNTAESESETANRKDEASAWKSKDGEYQEAIEACQGAVKALKESGGSPALLQTAYAAAAVADAEAAESLASYQEPAAYNYHSSEIIAVLQGLVVTFKEKQRAAWDAEANMKQTYNLAETARQNAIKVAAEEQANEEAASAEKEDEKNTKQDVKDAETADKEADESFLKKLTKQCEDKAKLFDQRSTSRAAELKALVEAKALLEGDGSQKYTANKKLTGFVDMGDEYAAVTDDDEIDEETAMFMQLQAKERHHINKRSPAERKVMGLLTKAARKLKSTVLSSLAIRLNKDHFVKVRALIKDLIGRLKAQGEADSNHHSECKLAIEEATTARDDSRAQIETEQGTISRLTQTIDDLKASTKSLQQEIADLNKALSEATELRNEEKTDNEKTIADAEAGENAVREAISILQKYYGFIQTSSSGKKAISLHRQPSNRGADREGNTVGDLAPETFDEEYRGAQESSNGIVGLLEVIATDYKRTQDTVSADEAAAADAHASFETRTKADIDAKDAEIESNDVKKSDAEDDLADSQDSLKLEKSKNKTALEELDVLKAKCIDNTVSYAERVKRRKQEIQALKDALAILEEMSFLQKRD